MFIFVVWGQFFGWWFILCFSISIYRHHWYGVTNCSEQTMALYRGLNLNNPCRPLEGKFRLTTGHVGPLRKYSCSCTLSLTLTLDGGGWLTPRPGCLSPGKETRCSFYRMRVTLDGQGKISPSPGFELRTAQPVASSNTDDYVISK